MIKLAMYLVLSTLSYTVVVPKDNSPKDMLILARLACSEAGTNHAESKRVLRVVYNRAKRRGTTVMEEATRPYQFAYKNCTGAREKWLRWFHFQLALETLDGSIKAETSINDGVTHFGTKTRLGEPHSRCAGFTIREVWKWYGLRKIKTTEVGHEYYKKEGGNAGCPGKNGNKSKKSK